MSVKKQLKIVIMSAERFMYQFIKSIRLKETIKFKELTEFDACFLIYRAPISFNLKDMLKDYMKFREFECAKYDEILKRASVIKGSSFPKNSKAYEVNKKK